MNKNLKYLIVLLLVVVLTGFFAYRQFNKPAEKKILYYQSGMHPWIKSDKPGKCPICGMDLMPVYEEKGEAMAGQMAEHKAKELTLTRNQLKHLNVQTATVGYKLLSHEIRAVGEVAYDPELVVAQEEFVAALASGMLVNSSRRKLRLLGMSAKEIDRLAKTKKVNTNLLLPEANMWIYAEIYEQDLSWVRVGQKAAVISISYPDMKFSGQVTAIEPVLDKKTRSAKVRIKAANPGLKLKPQMYVDVYLKTSPTRVLAVPKSAVLDTGERKVAYVARSAGVFQARDVVTGAAAAGFIPIIKGLQAGEKVVTSANFLIDSQSQLTGGSSALYGGASEVNSHDRQDH